MENEHNNPERRNSGRRILRDRRKSWVNKDYKGPFRRFNLRRIETDRRRIVLT